MAKFISYISIFGCNLDEDGKQNNLLKNNHLHHTVPNSSRLLHVNNPRPVSTLLVSSGEGKKHSTIKMLKKDKFVIGCKKKMQ